MLNKQIPKGPVSAVVACIILLAHGLLSIYLFTRFDEFAEDQVAVAQISLPITLAYAITVVTWIIAKQGKVSYRTKVYPLYVIGLAISVVFYFFALYIGLERYRIGDWTWERLNTYFAVVDGALGGLFLMFCNDLFSTEHRSVDQREAAQ